METLEHVITYRHNALGNGVAKLVDGEVVEQYLWQDKTTLLATYDGAGNLKQRFEYALGHTPTRFTQAGERYYILTDPVGSRRIIADAAGAVGAAVAVTVNSKRWRARLLKTANASVMPVFTPWGLKTLRHLPLDEIGEGDHLGHHPVQRLRDLLAQLHLGENLHQLAVGAQGDVVFLGHGDDLLGQGVGALGGHPRGAFTGVGQGHRHRAVVFVGPALVMPAHGVSPWLAGVCRRC